MDELREFKQFTLMQIEIIRRMNESGKMTDTEILEQILARLARIEKAAAETA